MSARWRELGLWRQPSLGDEAAQPSHACHRPGASPTTLAIRESTLSVDFKVASVTAASMCFFSGASMVFFKTLAMRRAMTWASRKIGLGEHGEDRIVGLAAGEIHLAHQPAQDARGVDAEAAIGVREGKARDGEPDAAFLGVVDGAVEIAPERLVGQQPGVGIDHAVGVERFEHAAQPLAEGVHAHERQEALDQALGPLGGALEIGQAEAERLDGGGMAAEHGDRQDRGNARRRPAR